MNSQPGSGACTEVDYSDLCSKLRAVCAMDASPTAWFTLPAPKTGFRVAEGENMTPTPLELPY